MIFNMVGKSGGGGGEPIELKSLLFSRSSLDSNVATTNKYRLTITFPREGEYFITSGFSFTLKNSGTTVSGVMRQTTEKTNCVASSGAVLELLGTSSDPAKTPLSFKVTATAANQTFYFQLPYPSTNLYTSCDASSTTYILYAGDTISSISVSSSVIRE